MSKDEETLVSKTTHVVGIILGSIAILLFFTTVVGLAALLNGLVIKVMWGWFLVPLGLPIIGYANAIGLGFLVRYLTWQQSPGNKEKDDKEVQMQRLLIAFIYPFIVLGLGFTVHLFM